jgi:D-alanyl-D-alanine dipeptidase
MNQATLPSLESSEARAFWTLRMDQAFNFMEKMRTYPLEECGEEMISLGEVTKGLEILFSTNLLNNQFPRVYFIRSGLADSFRKIATEMNDRGWILKVEDGYRSPEMQRAQSHNPKHFDTILQKVIWELGGKIPPPDMMLRRMSAMIATRCRIGTHVSGTAVDISVFDKSTGKEVDRGGSYIEFSVRTPMNSPFITPEQHANRQQITDIFARHGWITYPFEFWHYSSGDSYAQFLTNSGKPSRYGPVRFDGKKIEIISGPDCDDLLEPVEFYEKQIHAALNRLNQVK